MKRLVAVTGATGFMGKRLVQVLLDRGCEVRVFVRDRTRAVEAFGEKCEIVTGDTTDPDSLKGAFDGVDTVYHLAALMGHDLPGEAAFKKFRAVNVQGTKNVAAECRKAGVKHFIFISSTAAMGLIEDVAVVNEDTPCKPYTPYQVSKYECEQYLLQEFRTDGFPVIIVRPSMVYGPGYKGDFLTMAKLCKKGFFPEIGKGQNLSPALYITDEIEGLALLLDKGEPGQIYLLSSEKSYSLHETGEIIGKALGKKIHFVPVSTGFMLFCAGAMEKICGLAGKHSPVTRRNIRSVVTDRVFSTEKIRALGFRQKVGLEEGLTNAVHYFVEQHYL
ncbi:MAG: NAD-dependent epimerase/dehydratase family protein [Lachnospiraceae bacterium]|jgi:nucleoside-diphosphate-sugar epimerase|nr:NAD-dependent epimerase/dehydratase family protein [Lachnospiraceae bacterium]